MARTDATVVEAKVSLLKVPLERPFRAAGREMTDFRYVLVELRSSDGIEGFGYTVHIQPNLADPLLSATGELAQQLIGMPVLGSERAWERLTRAGRWLGPGGMLNVVVAGLDIALWDLAGKTLGQPLFRLLGGYRDRLPAYASDGFWYNLSLEELAESATRQVAEGFRTLKIRLGNEATPQDELLRVNAIRDAVGPDIRILSDAAEAWDVEQAIRNGRMLEEAGVEWLEDPIDHANVAGLAEIARRLDMTVATGEHLYEVGQFATLFGERASEIGLIDLARIGGVTPWRRVAMLAQAHGRRVCGHMLPEFHVHLLSAIPNGYMVEWMQGCRILDKMPELVDGALIAPELPGFGLSLNRDAVDRYREDR